MWNSGKWAHKLTGMTTWSDETTRRIGEQIKALRGKSRSAQWLADRTAELGHPVSRTAISEFETNKRKSIAVTDLAVIAAALNVPPITLIYPDLPDGRVETLPGTEATSIVAAQWFSGEGPNPSGERVENRRIARGRKLAQLRDIRQRAVVDTALTELNVADARFVNTEQGMQALDAIRSELNALVEFMRADPQNWPVDDA